MENNNQVLSLLTRISEYWKIYISSLFIGVIIGLVVYENLTPLYEGTVNVEIGQVGQVGQVESIAFILSYIKTPTFVSDIFYKSKNIELVKLVAKDGKGLNVSSGVRFLAKNNRDANILELKLRASSPELIRFGLDLIVKELEGRHAKKMLPRINFYNSISATLQSQIALEKEALKKHSSTAKSIDNKGNNLVEILNEIKVSNINSTIDIKQRYLNDIQILLLEPNTMPTHMTGDVYFESKNPVYPNLFVMVILGSLLGLFIAIIFIIWRNKK